MASATSTRSPRNTLTICTRWGWADGSHRLGRCPRHDHRHRDRDGGPRSRRARLAGRDLGGRQRARWQRGARGVDRGADSVKVYLVLTYEHDWDEPQICGVFSSEYLAKQYVPVLQEWQRE